MKPDLSGLPVTFKPDFLDAGRASKMFDVLSSELAWVRRDGAPRSEYWTNLFNQPYTYGSNVGRRTYDAQPRHETVDLVRDLISVEDGGGYLHGCFLNMYLDGNDALGWHADDDEGIDHSLPIAVVTLGETRLIGLKPQVKGAVPVMLPLTHGSLLLMHPGMQQTHFHAIIKGESAKTYGPRISMTYRALRRK